MTENTIIKIMMEDRIIKFFSLEKGSCFECPFYSQNDNYTFPFCSLADKFIIDNRKVCPLPGHYDEKQS